MKNMNIKYRGHTKNHSSVCKHFSKLHMQANLPSGNVKFTCAQMANWPMQMPGFCFTELTGGVITVKSTF